MLAEQRGLAVLCLQELKSLDSVHCTKSQEFEEAERKYSLCPMMTFHICYGGGAW